MNVVRTVSTVVACSLVLGCEAEEPSPTLDAPDVLELEAAGDSVSLVSGLDFPFRVEPACPGEGCSYGEWFACDTVLLYSDPGAGTPTGGVIGPGEPFVVETGTVLVDAPEVVVVTRPTPQISFVSGGLTFRPGDTLLVLNYLGEGFFDAWYADSILEVEVFWPWEPFHPGDDFEYGGEVVREGRSEFWVRTDGPPRGWIDVEASSLAAPNALDPDPPVCPPEA